MPRQPLSPARRRLVLAAVIGLVVLLLVVAPPLFNVNRLQRRIVASLSQSLGRPVHLDKVQLHLLPVPGLTLTNLVISEDPAFGDEPTARANEVTLTLRPASLWRRQVEVASIHFQNPSVNIVRSPQGRWNLEGLIGSVSAVNVAPTTQATTTAAPRFPYVDATGARINLKLGQVKQPISLNDADFSLFQPDDAHWRIALKGHPARTDTVIDQSGIVRVTGTVLRALHMDDVAVDLHATWFDIPLGDTTRILTAADLGARGTMQAEATLNGPLGNAAAALKLTLNDVHRADWMPSRAIDLSSVCNATLHAGAAQLSTLHCELPTPGKSDGAQPVMLDAPTVDLHHPQTTVATLTASAFPMNWALAWARLWSQRIPAGRDIPGWGDLSARRTADGAWRGTSSWKFDRGAQTFVLPWTFAVDPTGHAKATLLTSTLTLAPAALLTVSATVTSDGFTDNVSGTIPSADWLNITSLLPTLHDGTDALIPAHVPTDDLHVAMTCTASWSGARTCSAAVPTQRRRRH